MPKIALAAAAALLLGALTGCHWVPLSEGGKDVRVLDASAASACDKIGVSTAKTADRVLLFARTQRKIHEELEALARNEAADMGGNAIVPSGEPVEGRQTFDVYRCSGS